MKEAIYLVNAANQLADEFIKFKELLYVFDDPKRMPLDKVNNKVNKHSKNKKFIPMDKVLRPPKRNELCPCNSGLKFKKCCGI